MAKHDDLALMAHLMRRAGFGASRDELDEDIAWNAPILLVPIESSFKVNDIRLKCIELCSIQGVELQVGIRIAQILAVIDHPVTNENLTLIFKDLCEFATEETFVVISSRQRRQ